METTVKIIWDEPQDENWLCPENIQIALSAYYTDTKFEVTKAIPLETEIKPANGDLREKKQVEARRIMNYFIDNNIKTIFPNGDGGYLIALKEMQNLFNLVQIETDWEFYERCKKAIFKT